MVAVGRIRAAIAARGRYEDISTGQDCAECFSIQTIADWLARSFDFAQYASRAPRSAVDVWLVPAALTDSLLSLADVLTESDRKIAECHRHELACSQWLASRTMLRIALHVATRGQVPAHRWEFKASALGKPAVACGFPPINFSLSQNEVVSAIAISKTATVGVDVERLDQLIDDYVITCFASSRERSALSVKNQDARSRAFLKLWTLKEAYAKMLGLGLNADFALLEFSLDPVRLLAGDPVGLKTWTLSFEGRPCQVSLAFCSRGQQTASVDR